MSDDELLLVYLVVIVFVSTPLLWAVGGFASGRIILSASMSGTVVHWLPFLSYRRLF